MKKIKVLATGIDGGNNFEVEVLVNDIFWIERAIFPDVSVITLKDPDGFVGETLWLQETVDAVNKKIKE